jgi:hypothetical protein
MNGKQDPRFRLRGRSHDFPQHGLDESSDISFRSSKVGKQLVSVHQARQYPSSIYEGIRGRGSSSAHVSAYEPSAKV